MIHYSHRRRRSLRLSSGFVRSTFADIEIRIADSPFLRGYRSRTMVLAYGTSRNWSPLVIAIGLRKLRIRKTFPAWASTRCATPTLKSTVGINAFAFRGKSSSQRLRRASKIKKKSVSKERLRFHRPSNRTQIDWCPETSYRMLSVRCLAGWQPSMAP